MKGPVSNTPKIDPKLQFQIEKVDQAMREGLKLEASPLGPFFSLRFFNDAESVMLLGNRDQCRQIIREIQGALDLSTERKRRRR